jgi:hypothetical protein
MRKTGLFLLFIATVVLSACQKTDTPPGGNPISITVSPMTATAKGGDSVVFNVNITDNNTLKDVVVSQSLGGGQESQLASYSLTGKSYSFTYAYHVPTGFTGDIKVKFLVDDASNTNSVTATITVGSTGKDYNSYSAVLLGSYGDPVGSSYASSNNVVYTKSDAAKNSSLIDMIFFYGSTNKYSLAAPHDPVFDNSITSLGVQNWAKRNITNFKMTTLADFSSITKGADIATAYSNATGSQVTLANNLAAGNILAFQTEPGKYGLCQIMYVQGGNASTGAGEMKIQVIVQQ